MHQGQDDQVFVVKYLSSLYKTLASTISKNMANAIMRVWKTSSTEDLEKYLKKEILESIVTNFLFNQDLCCMEVYTCAKGDVE